MERQKRKLKGIADLYNIEDERLKRQPSPDEDVSHQNIPGQVITEKTTSQVSDSIQHIPHQNISEETTSQIPAISTVLPSKGTGAFKIEATAQVQEENTSSQDTSQQNV